MAGALSTVGSVLHTLKMILILNHSILGNSKICHISPWKRLTPFSKVYPLVQEERWNAKLPGRCWRRERPWEALRPFTWMVRPEGSLLSQPPNQPRAHCSWRAWGCLGQTLVFLFLQGEEREGWVWLSFYYLKNCTRLVVSPFGMISFNPYYNHETWFWVH